jgi:two-component system phosphate regulon sensor histidine kinase PhoR
MTAILGWCVAAVFALCTWWVWRRFAHDWRHLEQLLDELAAGRKPEGFVFRHGGRFARLTYPLEKIASEQEKLHHEIHDEAVNLRTILASMEEGVMVVDTHHTLRLVNPSFVALFDLKSDPVGQTVLRTLRETAFEELITTALRTGHLQKADVERTVDKRHFYVHAVPVREFAGGPCVVAIIRDITRLRQLEEVRREFVANVSHELRTPLSIFHGYLENLMDEPSMARKDQMEIFEILRKHSRRLNALLEDLLTLARLESRQEKMVRISMELPALLRSVAGDWTQKLATKKLALKVEAPEDLPRVSADPQRLEQVLHNLLENAVKYTETGGNIVLSAAAQNGEMEVRVEDSGQGIPPTDLPHIFERFYRADKARSREQGGTGLGLSIVKHIIQLHGGSVAAESKYGKGTTIILHLPLNGTVETAEAVEAEV